jgi:energy-coupling factor transporter ATP-binding protein EcfA2
MASGDIPSLCEMLRHEMKNGCLIVAEHDTDALDGLVDRLLRMEQGHIASERLPITRQRPVRQGNETPRSERLDDPLRQLGCRRGLSFSVEEGETVVLLGPNGCAQEHVLLRYGDCPTCFGSNSVSWPKFG